MLEKGRREAASTAFASCMCVHMSQLIILKIFKIFKISDLQDLQDRQAYLSEACGMYK